MGGATAGSIVSVVFSSSSGEAEPCSVPQKWAMVGAVGYGQEPEREIYRLDFEPNL